MQMKKMKWGHPHTRPCGHLWNCRCWPVHWWSSWCMCTWGCVCVPDEVHVEMMRVVGAGGDMCTWGCVYVPDEVHVEMMRVVGARGDRWCGGFGSQLHQMHYCVAVGGTGVASVQGHNLPSAAPFVWKTKLLPLVYLLLGVVLFQTAPVATDQKSWYILCGFCLVSVMIYVWILPCQCNDICVDSALSV